MTSFVSIDPTTGERFADYPALDARQIDRALDAARAAFAAWQRADVAERVAPLRRAAEILEARTDAYALLMAREMGKPLREGRAEILKCTSVCRYYAAEAAAMLADQPRPSDAARSYVSPRPLGVVLGIMPWNFPFWQAIRFSAPTLAAGNTVLLKHAPSVTGCALALEALWHEAGVPEGGFQILLAELDQLPAVIADPRVAAVSLTGSSRAGRAVAAAAGAALKPCVLELGGSDPAVVLADADLELAVEQCAVGRLINAGQSCIATKRIIVSRPLRAAFEEALLARLARLRVGDPRDEATELGPLAREDLRDALARQVTQSVAAGAVCRLGGQAPSGAGWYYPVTLLTDPPPGSPACREELFGPVATLIEAADEEDAIRLANDTAYGLGAAIYSRDSARAEAIARDRLEAGSAFVNAFVRSDPRLPFGGTKDSGWGRELGREGLLAFTSAKTVWVA
ncbi:MAG: aldehyde dehydrogenase family protein [Ardenticatenia bacterium]|nr:aldehyde dehydrogenase family protein [Ardenticatenia bacterium]